MGLYNTAAGLGTLFLIGSINLENIRTIVARLCEISRLDALVEKS